jgi:hypothetical protein
MEREGNLAKFTEGVTLHGMKYVFGEGQSSWFRRILWGLVIMFMFGGFCLNLVLAMVNYYRYRYFFIIIYHQHKCNILVDMDIMCIIYDV